MFKKKKDLDLINFESLLLKPMIQESMAQEQTFDNFKRRNKRYHENRKYVEDEETGEETIRPCENV